MTEVIDTYFPGQSSAYSWEMAAELGTYEVQHELDTWMQQAAGGPEQRRAAWAAERLLFAFTTRILKATQIQEFRDFERGRLGQTLPFWFFELDSQPYVSESLGASDGTANHVMPARNCTVTGVKNRTTSTTLTFSVTAGYGTGKEDRLTALTPTPSAGNILEATFTGRRRFDCRFNQRSRRRRFFNGGGTLGAIPQWDVQLYSLL